MSLYEISFSPTGGTRRVADCLAEGLGGAGSRVDLTDRKANFSQIVLTEDDTAILAVPSYGGRVPAVAAERLRQIRGGGARAVLVCVYGNRAYDGTLAELAEIARSAGFRPAAAVAAVAEHSIVRQYAAGRPNGADRQQLADFARTIGEKLAAGTETEPKVPGTVPQGPAKGVGLVPKATGACVRCGKCAAVCPVGAIDARDPRKVDRHACISCMACVAACPHSARKAGALMTAAAGLALKKACAVRKDCELFL